MRGIAKISLLVDLKRMIETILKNSEKKFIKFIINYIYI